MSSVASQRAAVCVTGGFRTYLRTYASQWQELVTAFPVTDVFFMISLEDTYKEERVINGHIKKEKHIRGRIKNHSRLEFEAVRDKLEQLEVSQREIHYR